MYKTAHIGGAVREMEDCWPSGVGLRGQALNRPGAALAEDRRGERPGKRRGLDRVRRGSGRRSRSARPSLGLGRVSSLRRRKGMDGIETEGLVCPEG
jgi:hypothetical protein